MGLLVILLELITNKDKFGFSI